MGAIRYSPNSHCMLDEPLRALAVVLHLAYNPLV